jgi:hypothetical protein
LEKRSKIAEVLHFYLEERPFTIGSLTRLALLTTASNMGLVVYAYAKTTGWNVQLLNPDYAILQDSTIVS